MNETRAFIDEEIRSNPQKFIITPNQLPYSNIVETSPSNDASYSSQDLLENELHQLLTNPLNSLNHAQFFGVIKAMIEGWEITVPDESIPKNIQSFIQAYCQSGSLSLLNLDMDNFSTTNFRFSHFHGDLISATLQRKAIELIEPHSGIVSGMGEEHRIALPIPLHDAVRVANNIFTDFTTTRFKFDEGDFSQSVSVGVASLSHCKPGTIPRLMSLTSGALVFSKKNGKGRVTIFGDK